MYGQKKQEMNPPKKCNCGCKEGRYGSFKSYITEVFEKPKKERKKPKKKQGQIFYKKK